VHPHLHSFPPRRSSDLGGTFTVCSCAIHLAMPRAMPSIPSVAMNGTTRRPVMSRPLPRPTSPPATSATAVATPGGQQRPAHHGRSEEHTSELQSLAYLV